MKKSKIRILLFLFFIGLFFLIGIADYPMVNRQYHDIDSKENLLECFKKNYGIYLEIDGVFKPNNEPIYIPAESSIGDLEGYLARHYQCDFVFFESKNSKKGSEIHKHISLEQYCIDYKETKHLFFYKALALGALMLFFWVFEIIPIFVTALFPMIFGPILGLIHFDQLANSYGNQNIFLFLGGFILALGLEKWKVHDQITSRILFYIGHSPKNILLGFMLSTALLSMWISNTATTLMMLPIATSIIGRIEVNASKSSNFALLLLLAIAYSANIGGLATLVGSPPNVQMAMILDQQFGLEVTFWDWMKIGLPISLLLLLIIYLLFSFRIKNATDLKIESVRSLKPWTLDQKKALVVFFSVVMLWVFREPIISITGIAYKDLAPALFGAVLLFALPSTKDQQPLLVWEDTKNVPWGILFLFGGGLGLAKILELNGVVDEISGAFVAFSDWNLFLIILILVSITIFATEVMSNLALVTLFIPIVALFSTQIGVSIEILCFPVAIAASCAFMFPIATPPNAIVFSSGKINMIKMAQIGLLINLLCIGIISVLAYYLLY